MLRAAQHGKTQNIRRIALNHLWANDAIFYHIYPLGACGAPRRNDFRAAPVNRLDQLYTWLDPIQALGANALYLGPLFESSGHGYDTADYFQLDRRLGDRATLANFAREVHRRGMRLVLDGVFNHVGRDFWAFRDLLANRQDSRYCGWFSGLDFGRSSPYGDSFSYEGWNGQYDLVKLNLGHPEVRSHLFEAVRTWVQDFEIDGLRLDAADVVDPDFMQALAAFCRGLRRDFWLMGEMVHGDYRRLANPGLLDSTTNYEMYKSLYSSHVDRNYFEISYALNRQYGPGGIYRDLALYNFADNHDVDRVASSLKNPAHLYPLYCLLFTIPGIPSIYYGSEWGITGRRSAYSDAALRPALQPADAARLPQPALAGVIARLARLRQDTPALRQGDYSGLYVAGEQMAFLRSHPQGAVVVAVNASTAPAVLDLRLPVRTGRLVDLLNPGETFPIANFLARLDAIPATWARILAIT
jgi:cyclomaltodextrinase / maltogenic alpha-amylase / neopullulanase